MNKQATAKAATKLERLTRSVEAMKTAESSEAIEDAWVDFLIAASTFYSTLEQGAKTNDKSKAWFGRKKHERRTDQLLRYLHHARNAEEHGIARITGRSNSKIFLKSKGAAVMLQSDGKNWNVVSQTGDVEYPGDVVTLVRVQDIRFGDWFDPPEQHLGQNLNDTSPPAIAELGAAYLGEMLSEAKALPG